MIPTTMVKSDGTPVAVPTGEWARGTPVIITAQNDSASGSITCRIVLGTGQVLSEVTSQGAYVIASCDAVIPR